MNSNDRSLADARVDSVHHFLGLKEMKKLYVRYVKKRSVEEKSMTMNDF